MAVRFVLSFKGFIDPPIGTEAFPGVLKEALRELWPAEVRELRDDGAVFKKGSFTVDVRGYLEEDDVYGLMDVDVMVVSGIEVFMEFVSEKLDITEEFDLSLAKALLKEGHELRSRFVSAVEKATPEGHEWEWTLGWVVIRPWRKHALLKRYELEYKGLKVEYCGYEAPALYIYGDYRAIASELEDVINLVSGLP